MLSKIWNSKKIGAVFFIRCCLLVLFLALKITPTFSQNNKAEKQIIETLKQQQTAWNAGDINTFMQGYWRNDSLQFITVKGITRGWDKMLNRYQLVYPDKASMGVLQMDIVKLEKINRHYYLVIGHWQLKREKDAPAGYFSLLFKKIKGRWLIVKDHTS